MRGAPHSTTHARDVHAHVSNQQGLAHEWRRGTPFLRARSCVASHSPGCSSELSQQRAPTAASSRSAYLQTTQAFLSHDCRRNCVYAPPLAGVLAVSVWWRRLLYRVYTFSPDLSLYCCIFVQETGLVVLWSFLQAGFGTCIPMFVTFSFLLPISYNSAPIVPEAYRIQVGCFVKNTL